VKIGYVIASADFLVVINKKRNFFNRKIK
jgi:hypothetical protein